MNIDTSVLLAIYLYGYVISVGTLVVEASWRDFFASAVAAVFWPIVIPIRIIRAIIINQ